MTGYELSEITIGSRVLVVTGLHRGAIYQPGTVTAIVPTDYGAYSLTVEGRGSAKGRLWACLQPEAVLPDDLEPAA